jgi:GxxExxY protein
VNREDAKIAKVRREIERVGGIVVDSAIQVHRALGPGLLESAYQACLAYELRLAGLDVRCEERLPVKYGTVLIDVGYRMDMLVEDLVVIENKSVEQLLPIHKAQLLTYLKISGHRLGYLLNWRVGLMKHGIKRMVLDL